jgi:hypothetical protein
MMTRKQFEMLAEIVRRVDLNEYAYQDTIRKRIANTIADELDKENPRFDRRKFLTACGVDTV